MRTDWSTGAYEGAPDIPEGMTIGDYRRSREWSPGRAERFIQRAKRVFPGSREIDPPADADAMRPHIFGQED